MSSGRAPRESRYVWSLSPTPAIPSDALPVGRLAPSPTGLLHLGHARSFLIAWWQARSQGGRVILRLEDLDGARARAEFRDQACRDLEWLGLDWDGKVRVQSAELERLGEALRSLVKLGVAYPCVCSRAEIRAAASAPQQGSEEARYPGTCRGRFESAEEAHRRTGREVGLRFAVPDGLVDFTDALSGRHAFDVRGAVGDFLVGRRDGTPAYQLAVVVDDAEQGITEVVRGDDLLSSTPRQLLLQRALGLPTPIYYHVPLVVDQTGRRLAKRHDDLSLLELRERGIDPRAIVHWAAQSAGVACDAPVSASECTPLFSMQRLPRGSVRISNDIVLQLAKTGH